MSNMNPKRILIARTDRLGDVVLTTPVIKLLRREFPDAYIAFMVRPYTKDVLINNKDIDEVITYDKDQGQQSFVDTVKFAMNLRKKQFDMAIAMHPTNRVHMIMFIAGIPVRIGYDRKLSGLLTKRIIHRKQEGTFHEVEYNFKMLENAGISTENADPIPYMFTGSEEKKYVDSIFLDKGLTEKVVAIHAGASCESKRWPVERFAEVCRDILKNYGCDIVLIGGPDTSEINAKISEITKAKIHDMTGRFSVGELAEFLRRCKLLISNDSGPVHIATAVDTPVLSIFGRSSAGLSPTRWKPIGDRNIVIHGNAGCDDCKAHNCENDFRCLEVVTSADVMEGVEKMLDK
jgi:lipopolysaccharide heptosyltransferase II